MLCLEPIDDQCINERMKSNLCLTRRLNLCPRNVSQLDTILFDNSKSFDICETTTDFIAQSKELKLKVQ
ncbi:hypothetical protein GJ496_004219 [Pomphorhynchus laevis]|nr:hypothetical protein GJ496_004219 [Pomphorhynchus laevis]